MKVQEMYKALSINVLIILIIVTGYAIDKNSDFTLTMKNWLDHLVRLLHKTESSIIHFAKQPGLSFSRRCGSIFFSTSPDQQDSKSDSPLR